MQNYRTKIDLVEVKRNFDAHTSCKVEASG